MPGFFENLLGNLNFNVAGGQDQADREFQAALFGAQQQQFRLQEGGTLLDRLMAAQQMPFNFGNVINATGQLGGGGPTGQLGALEATGNRGFPAPFSPIIQQLIETQAGALGGAPTNPNTGMPFTPNELAYIRIILGQQGQAPTGQVDPSTGFAAFGPQAQTASPKEAAGSRPQTEELAGVVNRIRQGTTAKRAGRFLNGSALSPTQGSS